MPGHTLRCPTCSSLHTQTLEAAYAQSSRHDGRWKITQFAERIEPPQKRDAYWNPTVVFALTSYLANLAVVFLGASDAVPALHGAHFFAPHVLVLCLSIGALVGGCLCFRALRFNHVSHPDLLADWLSNAVCRRCLHTFPHNLGSGQRDY